MHMVTNIKKLKNVDLFDWKTICLPHFSKKEKRKMIS